MALRSFRGGVHPPEHKELTEDRPLEAMSVPEEIYLPLGQHLGKPATPLVKKGDYVRQGQVGSDIDLRDRRGARGGRQAQRRGPRPALGRCQ